MVLAKQIKAERQTWLKKDWAAQGKDLPDNKRVLVAPGKSYRFEEILENSLETKGDQLAGHALVKLAYGQGSWYLYTRDWQYPWDIVAPYHGNLPEWHEVDWEDYLAPVSKYFKVAEVVKCSRDRIPQGEEVKKNIIAIARKLDEVRAWWRSPILVNSWNRPPDVERLIGGSGRNHPFGYSVDIRPKVGSIAEFERRFEREWYLPGKWLGGFGKGQRKGFIHLDLRKPEQPRTWIY